MPPELVCCDCSCSGEQGRVHSVAKILPWSTVIQSRQLLNSARRSETAGGRSACWGQYKCYIAGHFWETGEIFCTQSAKLQPVMRRIIAMMTINIFIYSYPACLRNLRCQFHTSAGYIDPTKLRTIIMALTMLLYVNWCLDPDLYDKTSLCTGVYTLWLTRVNPLLGCWLHINMFV